MRSGFYDDSDKSFEQSDSRFDIDDSSLKHSDHNLTTTLPVSSPLLSFTPNFEDDSSLALSPIVDFSLSSILGLEEDSPPAFSPMVGLFPSDQGLSVPPMLPSPSAAFLPPQATQLPSLSSSSRDNDFKTQEQGQVNSNLELIAQIKALASYLNEMAFIDPDHSINFLKKWKAPFHIQRDLQDALSETPIAAEKLVRAIFFLSKQIHGLEYSNFHEIVQELEHFQDSRTGSMKISSMISNSGTTDLQLLAFNSSLEKSRNNNGKNKKIIAGKMRSAIAICFIGDLLNHPRFVKLDFPVGGKRKKRDAELEQVQNHRKKKKAEEQKRAFIEPSFSSSHSEAQAPGRLSQSSTAKLFSLDSASHVRQPPLPFSTRRIIGSVSPSIRRDDFELIEKIKEWVFRLENQQFATLDSRKNVDFLIKQRAPLEIQRDFLDIFNDKNSLAEKSSSLWRVVLFLSKKIKPDNYFNFHQTLEKLEHFTGNKVRTAMQVAEIILKSGTKDESLLQKAETIKKKLYSKYKVDTALRATTALGFVVDLLSHPRAVTLNVPVLSYKEKRKEKEMELRRSQNHLNYPRPVTLDVPVLSYKEQKKEKEMELRRPQNHQQPLQTKDKEVAAQQGSSTTQVLSRLLPARDSRNTPSLSEQPSEEKRTVATKSSSSVQSYLARYAILSEPEQHTLIEQFVRQIGSLLKQTIATPQALMDRLCHPESLAVFLLTRDRLARQEQRLQGPTFFPMPTPPTTTALPDSGPRQSTPAPEPNSP